MTQQKIITYSIDIRSFRVDFERSNGQERLLNVNTLIQSSLISSNGLDGEDEKDARSNQSKLTPVKVTFLFKIIRLIKIIRNIHPT